MAKKKATTKKVAKKATKKAASKKDSKLSKEDAIKKYKKEHPIAVKEEVNAAAVAPTPVEVEVDADLDDQVSLEDLNESTEGFQSQDNTRLEKEYNPDDESEDDDENLGYGWGYEDAFDRPEEEEETGELLDEDELYARGMSDED